MEDSYWSVKQTAEYLGLSRDTVYRYSREGKLISFKIGRLIKFKKEILDAYVRKHKRRQDNGEFN